MRDSAIRHITVSEKRPILAAGLFESTVQVWSWETREQLGQFETILDFGGERLILSGDAETCVAGSWKRGIAAYSVPDGKMLWHRKELSRVQRMARRSGMEIYCSFDKRPLLTLDAKSGKNLEMIADASAAFQSRLHSYRLLVLGKKYLVQGDNQLEIRAHSFTIWGAAFSQDSVCISEPDAGIRCIALDSGEELWRHEGLESDVITFNETDGQFYCVAQRKPSTQGCSLIRLAKNLVECDQVTALGQSAKMVFDPTGKVLIASDGRVRDTSTGSLLTRLDFPQCDYPENRE
jgi:hypothetical protein